jgi:hypothetical protein
MSEATYSPECDAGMHHACHGCDACYCHHEPAFEYDPLNDDPFGDPEGD